MNERRKQKGGTEEEIHNRINERAKYAIGLKQERRGSKKMTETSTDRTVWTAEGITKLGELLIKFDQESADAFITEFNGLNLKNAKGVKYTEEQIKSKYPNVRKILVRGKVLGDDAKFVGRRSSAIISEEDLIAAMKKYKASSKKK